MGGNRTAIPRVRDVTCFVQVFAWAARAGYAIGVIKAHPFFMSARRAKSESASCMGRRYCTGLEFMVVAGAGVAEAGTDVMGVVVGDEVTLLEGLSCRPIAEVGCVGPESLGRLRRPEEPSIKGVPNLPAREAGFFGNADRSLASSCGSRSWSSSLCGTPHG